MKGKLIVIEAGDGSGKATQTQLLYDRLVNQNKFPVKKVEFPNYKSESSALIKMYLNGEFGLDPSMVNPYATSTFYTVDRFVSYKKEWEDFYHAGGIVIADRYTTSNMIHQAAKLIDNQERKDYLDWLWDFEFNKFKLPIPDCVVFLDMPPQFSLKLIRDRPNKFGENDKDIHERNSEFLINSYNNAQLIAQKYGWIKINCVERNVIRSKNEIHNDILEVVERHIN